MDASRARQRLKEIEAERRSHEGAIVRMRGPLVAGSLVSRYTRCKRPGCKCGKGEPHGPFLYLSQRIEGKTKWSYLGKATEGRIAKAVKRYQAYREHLRELKRLAAEAEACCKAIGADLERSVEALKAGGKK